MHSRFSNFFPENQFIDKKLDIYNENSIADRRYLNNSNMYGYTVNPETQLKFHTNIHEERFNIEFNTIRNINNTQDYQQFLEKEPQFMVTLLIRSQTEMQEIKFSRIQILVRTRVQLIQNSLIEQ